MAKPFWLYILLRHGAYAHCCLLAELTSAGMQKKNIIPKNSEKCNLLLNSMKMNGSDIRPPPRSVLPQLEQLHDCLLLRKERRVYMIKFDVSNCYWSIVMPRA